MLHTSRLFFSTEQSLLPSLRDHLLLDRPLSLTRVGINAEELNFTVVAEILLLHRAA